MPADPAALLALGDLATTPPDRPPADPAAGPPEPVGTDGPDEPLWPAASPSGAARSRRLAVLACASVAAGLVCGLVAPSAEADGVPARPPAPAVPTASGVLGRDATPFTRASSTAAPAPEGASSAAPTARVVRPVADPEPPRAGSAPPAYVPSRPLPARSGTGRRIVYAERAAHVWVVDAAGRVVRDYPVTGRPGRPRPGTYHVYSKSPVAVNPGEHLAFADMVRFAHGLTGARIGFHTIPRRPDGSAIQTESGLGRATGSGGCVRQSRADAAWLYAWSRLGDTVVVLP